MKNIWFGSKIFTGAILIFSVFIVGCNRLTENVDNKQPVPNNSNSANNSINVEKQIQNDTVAKKNAPSAVTLPILDALFYDESFKDELKQNLQISDEEMEKLLKIASDSVKNLSETENEATGSTRNEIQIAKEKINEIIGTEKSAKLFEIASNRWATGNIDENSFISDEPNLIPTDTRIVVNAPSYRMDVFQNGNLVKTYKIGVGYPEFPLPQGIRKAEKIIFNPTWTPPDEPWVKGNLKPGKTVKAGSKQNPLGPIKIPIGLPSLIHGGKNANRLGNFASHGCVGLTNTQIQDFSMLLSTISETNLTENDVAEYEKNETVTKEIPLLNPILVELRYETIVVEDGKLIIYRDIYEQGTNNFENLKKVLDYYQVSFESLNEENKTQILKGLSEMNKDAQGKAIVQKDEKSDTDEKESSKTTKNVKGNKDFSIILSELSGKGYPKAVNYNEGI